MKKTAITLIVIVVSFISLLIVFVSNNKKEAPTNFTASASLRKLSIDEKITEAQIILVGKAKTTLPSKWKYHNEKDTKRASSKEIYEAEGLFTDSILSVEQVLKGDFKEPIIRVRSFTGETEQIRWEDTSQVLYKKGHTYLLFLRQDTGPTANVDPGYYRSVNANTAVYEIIDGRAISPDDEWVLDDLIAYIQNSVSTETIPLTPASPSMEPLIEPSLLPTDTPLPSELITATP
jgi:hypothetical protein